MTHISLSNISHSTTADVIRPATLEDLPCIQAVIQKTFALSCPPDTKAESIDYFLTHTLHAQAITESITSEVHHVFVAEVDNSVVGLGMVESINETQAEFSKLYVDSAYHGRGLGKKLANTMINQATTSGFSEMLLYVYKHNTTAKGLYKKLGFHYQEDSKFHIYDEIHDDEIWRLVL